jgi:hypothetical protein
MREEALRILFRGERRLAEVWNQLIEEKKEEM